MQDGRPSLKYYFQFHDTIRYKAPSIFHSMQYKIKTLFHHINTIHHAPCTVLPDPQSLNPIYVLWPFALTHPPYDTHCAALFSPRLLSLFLSLCTTLHRGQHDSRPQPTTFAFNFENLIQSHHIFVLMLMNLFTHIFVFVLLILKW